MIKARYPRTTNQVDFDLHGLVGVRLLAPSPADASAVARQLGPIRATLLREPDITIRFVDELPLAGNTRYLNNDTGYTDEAFFVLRGKHQSRVRVQLPLEHVGGPCEIICERSVCAVPFLLPIINLTALGKGALPLHASAFMYEGIGVLTTGWSKGGKTETLLAFMNQGAKYVGDEWVYVSSDGQQMFGVPEPIRIWDWQFSELPQFRSRVSHIDRLRMQLIRAATRPLEWAALDRRPIGFSRRAMCKLTFLLNQQRYVQMPPRKIFGSDAFLSRAAPAKVFFVASHAAPTVTVTRIDAEEIAQRMVFSLEQERADLLACYRKFRFAFPDRSNPLLENTEQLQRQRLREVLAGKTAYAVYHPYPVSIPALFDAMRPFVER